jgi:flavin reductase (DIM6/NTAB) family NADH-FMN oxidoreductase RutF
MGHFASGVTVVTTVMDGVYYGLTVSSFASLSLVPQLVLVSIDQSIASHAVNILPENGEHLSRHFASRDPDKFRGVAYHTGETGAPLLEDALATIDCRIVQETPGGDHTIFVGEVLSTTVNEGKPLLYFRSGYHQLA